MAALKELFAARPDLGPAATPAPPITYMLEKIADSKARGMTRGMRATEQRLGDFSSPMEAMLTGVALDPVTREYADVLLDEYWTNNRGNLLRDSLRDGVKEVIIGSGFHAAVYAATRVLSGHPKPLVIERNPRAGGTFAMTTQPTFYLNSRNRPGGPGLAGDLGASLNYLPGAPIQAANLSTSEYQDNTEMAFVIRLTLAQYADVLVNASVTQVVPDFISKMNVYIAPGGVSINSRRIIDARGIGDPNNTDQANGKTIMTFEQFMTHMAEPWPFRGIRRIAVIGDGDSARCAVEAALGLGPEPYMAPAALDAVERVDMYGPTLPQTCERWQERERGRYKQIGRYLRNDLYGVRLLNVIRDRVTPVAIPGRTLINGRSYDLAVLATGHKSVDIDGLTAGSLYMVGGTAVARRDGRVYRVGPHANLPFSDQEAASGISTLPNNRVAMFRLATKTAALAATLTA